MSEPLDQVTGCTSWGSNPGKGKWFFSSPKRPASVLFSECRCSFPGVKRPGCESDNSLPTSSEVTMCGAVTPRLQYVFKPCAGTMLLPSDKTLMCENWSAYSHSRCPVSAVQCRTHTFEHHVTCTYRSC